MPDSGQRPRVSVIIPVYNDRERLGRCLKCLQDQTYPSERFEVLVVDNASDDPVEELVEAYGENFVPLYESKKGSYAARNTGAEHASGEIFAFTDADCIPQPGWLWYGVEALSRAPQIGSVGGSIEMVLPNGRDPSMFDLYDLVFGLPQERHVEEMGYAVTANMFTPSYVFEEVGGFRDSIKSGGDAVYGEAVREQGFHLLYCPEAKVHHPTRGRFRERWQRQRRTAQGLVKRGKRPNPSVVEEIKRLGPPVNAWRQIWEDIDLDIIEKVKVGTSAYILKILRSIEVYREALRSQEAFSNY